MSVTFAAARRSALAAAIPPKPPPTITILGRVSVIWMSARDPRQIDHSHKRSPEDNGLTRGVTPTKKRPIQAACHRRGASLTRVWHRDRGTKKRRKTEFPPRARSATSIGGDPRVR